MFQQIATRIAIKLLSLLGQALLDWLEKTVKEGKRKKAQDIAKIEYDKVKVDPNKTLEEKAKAYEDYQNAGRS